MSSAKLEKLVSLIFRTERVFREKIRDGDSIDPFTVLRLETMRFINSTKSPTMKDVAENIHVTAPSATTLINSLVKAGFVRRKQGSSDRRKVCLEVTTKGKGMLEEGFALMAKRMKQTLSLLEDDDVETLTGILQRFADAHEKNYQLARNGK